MMIEFDWWQTFIDFIKEQKLPPGIDEKSAEAACVIRRSKGYVLISDKLYKRGLAIGILMKCVQTEEGKAIFWEIHEGTCCNHVASRTLVGKSFRSGFYWPMALADTEELVRRCTKYTTSTPYHLPGRSHAAVLT
jgi:hypothetical protein